jgi:hypothetical protein
MILTTCNLLWQHNSDSGGTVTDSEAQNQTAVKSL